MSKRTTSGQSTPRKKPKLTSGQNSLDRFFHSSPRKTATGGRQETESNPKGKHKLKADCAAEIIDVDLLDDPPAPSSHRTSTVQPAVPRSPTPKTAAKFSGLTLSSITLDSGSAVPGYSILDIDPLSLDLTACPWRSSSPAPFSFLTHLFATLSQTRSRIRILNTITNGLRMLLRYDAASLLPALWLLSNTLSPPYSAVELGLGPAVLHRAIQHISGLTSAALKTLYNKHGDPGDVAFEAKSNVRTLLPHPPLTITGVHGGMLKIASAKGEGAAKQKQAIVEKLLIAAKGEETRYLVRSLCQNNRVGAARITVLTALARSIVLTSPPTLNISIAGESRYHASAELLAQAICDDESADEARKRIGAQMTESEALIKKTFVQRPDYNAIVSALLEGGLDGIIDRVPLAVGESFCRPSPEFYWLIPIAGIPLHPTLGSPTRSLDEIYERFEDLPFVAEFKYDGQRAQVHVWAEPGVTHVKIFSRHLEDMTEKYPDVVALMNHIYETSPDKESFILDAEVVAVDAEDGSIRSFQELSNRARKVQSSAEVKIAVCVFAFDLMYLNSKVLLCEPFRKRRELLHTHFTPFVPLGPGIARFDHVESCGSEQGRDYVEEFWQQAVESRCEGLMIKACMFGEVHDGTGPHQSKSRRKPLPATYEPDKRTSAWLKLKKDYVSGLGDSLDLVPVGAWHGNGRKAQWWSPILLAVRDASTGQLVAMCKCMSGFTDTFYKALREKYAPGSDNCASRNIWQVETGGLKPEVYFKPVEVWEIRGADVTLSPVSVAGIGMISSRGCSLRFPRFIKIRIDKTTEEASTAEFLVQMYKDQQARGKDQTGADEGDLVDVDYESVEEADDDSANGGEG
ncbi:DNA ligase [Punctularia strigosozonata HHB-11173 SS5]|uniref:DNA ligase n=1 Tax=Punctularia strigosozonata (strain HHB-11173) TaxID=741275 RepID=UPI0004416F09|nr:DNA ligase [Punctularia strigosozonata HHB-11173 SS5]EIN11841.1 DNA ligase [Punctularia strigosozonata HHB-11173 SS5]